MTLRHFVIPLVGLFISSFCITFVFAVGEGNWALFFMGIFFVGNAFFPTLLSAFIFYFLTRRGKTKPGSFQIFKLALLYIILCAIALVLWAIGEAAFAWDLSFDRILEIYNRDLYGWNLLLIAQGFLIPFLFYDEKFLSSIK